MKIPQVLLSAISGEFKKYISINRSTCELCYNMIITCFTVNGLSWSFKRPSVSWFPSGCHLGENDERLEGVSV